MAEMSAYESACPEPVHDDADPPELTEMNRLNAWNWLMTRLNALQFHTAIEAGRRAGGETVITPWGIALRLYQKTDSFWYFAVGETTAPHDCGESPACSSLSGCPFRELELSDDFDD